jgi:RHS repeat-associated protein
MNLTTPSGQVVTYGYNAAGQVTSVSVNGTTVLSNVLYEPFGATRGWTWGNGTYAVRTRDTDGRITQIDSGGLRTYAYDDASRITGITDTVTPANSWTYGYDTLDRLVSGVSSGTTRGWTYDPHGNRLTETGTAPATYVVSSTSNRVSSISGSLPRSYGYDAAGNTTGYASAGFTYNNRGRMLSASFGGNTATYVYNALGQRIKRLAASVSTLYMYDESGHLLGEYDGAGNLVQETVWLGDIPVATLRPNGSTVDVYYVHTDHLNTPRLVTQPSNNAVRWSWNSDPFGTNAPNENPAALGVFKYNLRFPGQQYDGIAGLSYNYFRDYDAATGRYVESDPIGLSGGLNTYAYVRENPVGIVDSNGLQGWSLGPADLGKNTTVCDGKGGITTQLQPLSPLNDKCLSDCMLLHELIHVEQIIRAGAGWVCRDGNRGQIVQMPATVSQQFEKTAYAVERDCLRRKLESLTDCDDCIAPVKKRLDQIATK